MRTKNTLPVKWMIGIIIALTLVTHRTYQMSHNMSLSGSSDISSSQNKNFFQFLAEFLGFGGPNASSNGSSVKNNGQNQNNPGSQKIGAMNQGDQGSPSTSVDGGLSSQGSIADQQRGAGGNNLSIGGGNNPDTSLEDNFKNSDMNPENNSEMNADNNPQNNSETNSETGSGNNSGSNSGIGSGSGSGNNTSDNSTTNSTDNSGNNSGGTSGGNSGGGSDNGSGNGSGNPGNNPGYTDPSSLPTINPIPTDDSVSQSVGKENQQNDSLSALVASRQALTVPVQQQAQANKFQTVDPSNIPAPSTNQPPADVQAKAQAKQITFH